MEKMNKELVERLFPGTVEKIEKKICPSCNNDVGVFRDLLSEKEYKISGMCQSCQDSVFKK